jgi:hypothetical protein
MFKNSSSGKDAKREKLYIHRKTGGRKEDIGTRKSRVNGLRDQGNVACCACTVL